MCGGGGVGLVGSNVLFGFWVWLLSFVIGQQLSVVQWNHAGLSDKRIDWYVLETVICYEGNNHLICIHA